MIILRLAQLLLVRRVFESGRAALDSFPRTEDVVLVDSLGKVDWLGYHAGPVVPPMLVTLILCVGAQPAHELVVGAVGTDWLRLVAVDRVESKMLSRHPVGAGEFRNYL